MVFQSLIYNIVLTKKQIKICTQKITYFFNFPKTAFLSNHCTYSNKKSPVCISVSKHTFSVRYLGDQRNPFLNTMIWQENIYVSIFNCILKKITRMYFSLDTDSEDHSSAAHGSPSAESFDAKSYGNISPNRSFNNYVHIILTFFWPLAYTYLLLRGYFCP